MKSTWWTLCGVAALLAAPALAGEGDKPAKGDKPPRGEDFRQKMLEEFDADGDGELSDDERTKMRESRRERGAGERGKGERGGEARRRGPGGPGGERGFGPPPGGPGGPGMMMDPGRLFDRVDEDGDGSVTREEFTGFFEKMREMRGGRGPGEGGGPGGDRIGRRPGGERGERGRPEGRPEGRRGRRGPAEDRPAESSKPAAEEASADVPL